MAIFSTASLFITLTIFCCFILSPPFISLADAARYKVKAQLATQVCRNTTDFSFCLKTIYSDPRAPTADRIVLAYIAFGNAYLNSSNTQTQIQLKITDAENGKSDVLDGLKSCMGHYTKAIGALSQGAGKLGLGSYYGFDKLSIEAQSHVRDCEKGFNATIGSPMTKENVDVIKLTNICNVVAQLFPYTD
ncbi:pectinesterase inhibitor [Phtheirospermum japonicum]|uniref:Pectinesterase inhibitor n=1 Tax=Phtheirospermum japonicum TaxID=374723 RepID=A0A830D6M1_9LAMI|nr:pectinesterase inhibitor [Phtheirospermum japonicum]